MPNYCNNLLEVDGKDTNKFKNDVQTNNSELSFNNLIPTPEFNNMSKEEFTKLFTEEEQSYPFFEYYANSNRDWYSFRLIKWGTKWDAMDIITNHSEDELNYDFTTAWSPPKEWLKNICKNYNCNFYLTSYEFGSDFWYKIIIRNGQIIKETNLTLTEKIGIDLQNDPNYNLTKQLFIEKLGEFDEEFDDQLEEMEEFEFIAENLEHPFSEHFIYKYFEEIKNAFFYLRSSIQQRKNKIKLIQFQNFFLKQNMFNELTAFHTCPPMDNIKLLKNGGFLYQEAEKHFYRNYNFFLIYKYVKTTFCDVMYRFPLQQPHRRLLQTHR